jgi:ketosteroid isomerase-like protein
MDAQGRQAANLAQVQRLYGSLFAGDWDVVASVLADDFVVEEAPSLPFGGEWKGLEGLKRFFAAMATQHFDQLDIQPKGAMANEEFVASYFALSGIARLTGRRVAAEIVEIASFKDGKVSRLKPFYFDGPAVIQAFAR